MWVSHAGDRERTLPEVKAPKSELSEEVRGVSETPGR